VTRGTGAAGRRIGHEAGDDQRGARPGVLLCRLRAACSEHRRRRAATETASFSVDSRCQTLRLAGKVSKIAERKHAVIHLDVARSFVPSSTGLMLVPHFQLVY